MGGCPLQAMPILCRHNRLFGYCVGTGPIRVHERCSPEAEVGMFKRFAISLPYLSLLFSPVMITVCFMSFGLLFTTVMAMFGLSARRSSLLLPLIGLTVTEIASLLLIRHNPVCFSLLSGSSKSPSLSRLFSLGGESDSPSIATQLSPSSSQQLYTRLWELRSGWRYAATDLCNSGLPFGCTNSSEGRAFIGSRKWPLC